MAGDQTFSALAPRSTDRDEKQKRTFISVRVSRGAAVPGACPASPARLPCPPAQHVWAAGGPPRPRETSARARPPPQNACRPGGFRVARTADRCGASGQFLGGPPGWAQGAERVEVWRWPAGALPTPGTRRGARCRRPRACRHGGGHRGHGVNHTCHIPRRAQSPAPVRTQALKRDLSGPLSLHPTDGPRLRAWPGITRARCRPRSPLSAPDAGTPPQAGPLDQDVPLKVCVRVCACLCTCMCVHVRTFLRVSVRVGVCLSA